MIQNQTKFVTIIDEDIFYKLQMHYQNLLQTKKIFIGLEEGYILNGHLLIINSLVIHRFLTLTKELRIIK